MTRGTRTGLLVLAGVVVTLGGIGAAATGCRARSASPSTPSAAPSAELKPEEHCDANGWCRPDPLRAAPPRGEKDTLAGVWAAAPNDVHAVGLSGTAYHFDGVRWSARGTGERILRHVHGVASDAVWLVGGRTAFFWNGKELVRHHVPVRGELCGVHTLSRNEAWAVSSGGDTAHFDGHSWKRVDAPYHGWLLAVWGASPSDYWAGGGSMGGPDSEHALHWDGRKWTRVKLPAQVTIEALSGTGPNDVWAVGSWGRLLHYDGKRWKKYDSPAWRGLGGVWALARNDVWAVGEEGMVLHYDGKAWVGAKPDWNWLRGVAGTPSRELFAVGNHGLVLHWRGAEFRGEPKPPPRKKRAALPPLVTTAKPEPMAPQYAAALARARKLQSAGNIDAASQAFIEASGKGQTVNLRPIVEHAHMLLTHDTNDDTVTESLAEDLEAGAKEGDPELEAQAWYNLALLRARQGRAEAERAALARSLLVRDHASVRAKLGARPACAAEVDSFGGPEVVTGWVEVCRTLGLCQEKDAVSEADARRRSCLTCSGTADGPDESHGCEGEGPWESTFGYSLYAMQQAWIAPAGNNRFFVANDRTGSWYSICRGSGSSQWQSEGKFAVQKLTRERLKDVPGRPIPQAHPDDGVCLALPSVTTTAVFELATARALGAVTAVDHHGVKVELDAARSRLALSGGGCDGYFVPLDGAPRLVRE